LKKILGGHKINISILGYGHIAKALVSGIVRYNNANKDNPIDIGNILVKSASKHFEEKYNFTENPEDIYTNSSDLIIDLMNNVDYSVDYLPKIMSHKKSVLIAGKIFLSEHGELIFKNARENDVRVLIGSCISADLPINLSTKNPYYTGQEYKESRGNNSADVSAAILEDIFYFYS
jgi:homoserine dehydrogenase